MTVSVCDDASTSVIENVALPLEKVGLVGSVGGVPLGLLLAPPQVNVWPEPV